MHILKERALIRISLSLLLVFFCAFAQGKDVCQPEAIRQAAFDRLAMLEQAGIDSIDGKSLSEIRDVISTTTIRIAPEIRRSSEIRGTMRETARWDARTRSMTVSQDHCERLGEQSFGEVTLHEFFGLAGVRDNNFGKTGAINNLDIFLMIQRTQPDLITDPMMGTHIKNQIIKMALYGGSTGVEGGGDSRLNAYVFLLYKEILFLYLKDVIDGINYERLCEIVDIFNIEFSEQIPQGDLRVLAGAQLTLVVPDHPLGSRENLELNSARVRQFFDDLLNKRFHLSVPGRP